MKPLTHYCRRRRIEFWGQTYVIRPRLVNWIHGDGLQLIALQPLATRPDRYLARIDSKIDLSNQSKSEVCFGEQVLESLYDHIEEQFGRAYWEDDNGRERHDDFPALNDSCGCSWWQVAMLDKPDTRKARKVWQDVQRSKTALRRAA